MINLTIAPSLKAGRALYKAFCQQIRVQQDFFLFDSLDSQRLERDGQNVFFPKTSFFFSSKKRCQIASVMLGSLACISTLGSLFYLIGSLKS